MMLKLPDAPTAGPLKRMSISCRPFFAELGARSGLLGSTAPIQALFNHASSPAAINPLYAICGHTASC